MGNIFWVYAPAIGRKGVVFVGTRTTASAANKLAEKELCRNIYADGPATVLQCKYDSYGNLKEIIQYFVNRSGSVNRFLGTRDVTEYAYTTGRKAPKYSKQYGVDDFGNLIKRDIEPALYTVFEHPW